MVVVMALLRRLLVWLIMVVVMAVAFLSLLRRILPVILLFLFVMAMTVVVAMAMIVKHLRQECVALVGLLLPLLGFILQVPEHIHVLDVVMMVMVLVTVLVRLLLIDTRTFHSLDHFASQLLQFL